LKTSLRKKIAEARDGLLQKVRESKSREIECRLFSLPEFQSAAFVLFFASFRSEVNTMPMIQHALDSGKRVVLPKVKGRDLMLFEIKDFIKDIEPGAFGIPEPRETWPVALSEIGFVIVPGLAFDEHGNRLGYGAGFYDKLLKEYTGATAAVAFELQIVPTVPADAHDIPIQKIVTEQRVIAAQ